MLCLGIEPWATLSRRVQNNRTMAGVDVFTYVMSSLSKMNTTGF